MLSYTVSLHHRVIYSLGDTHGRGREQISFVEDIRALNAKNTDEDIAFIQLGDLCDGFSFVIDGHTIDPESGDAFIDALCCEIHRIGNAIPKLGNILDGSVLLVNWHKHTADRDGDVVGTYPARDLIARRDLDEIIALYEACKSYETLDLFSSYQAKHPDSFHVILGNHDVDLLLGLSRYGRQQKYLLLGLLGFTPDQVIAHLTRGEGELHKKHPYLAWLYERPHLALSSDTIYMHGGPTTDLSNALLKSKHDGFNAWLAEIDEARNRGLGDPQFREHESFLSPDGANNDWTQFPERLTHFLDAANRRFAAVGHSPFLDFTKGTLIDLKLSTYGELFETPAQLPPDNRLVKHDTNLKRGGQLWICKHEVGSNDWFGIDRSLRQTPLRSKTPGPPDIRP